MFPSLLACLLAAGTPAPRASVTHAIQLFNNLQSDSASAELHLVLQRHPKTSDAARAHLYLGLVAFNSLDIDAARSEFRQALLLNPAIELPFNSSPKTRVTFAQVRQDLGEAGASAAVADGPRHSEAAPATVVPLVLPDLSRPVPEVTQVEAVRPIPAGFWVTLGLGAAAAAAGLTVGIVSQTPAASATSAPDVASATRDLNQATAERIAADSCYGAAVVAGVVALVVYLTRGSATPAPAGAP